MYDFEYCIHINSNYSNIYSYWDLHIFLNSKEWTFASTSMYSNTKSDMFVPFPMATIFASSWITLQQIGLISCLQSFSVNMGVLKEGSGASQRGIKCEHVVTLESKWDQAPGIGSNRRRSICKRCARLCVRIRRFSTSLQAARVCARAITPSSG